MLLDGWGVPRLGNFGWLYMHCLRGGGVELGKWCKSGKAWWEVVIRMWQFVGCGDFGKLLIWRLEEVLSLL